MKLVSSAPSNHIPLFNKPPKIQRTKVANRPQAPNMIKPKTTVNGKSGLSIDIFGERNSGTNWVSVIVASNIGKLLEQSFHSSTTVAGGTYAACPDVYTTKFGWKHGMLRRDLLTTPKLNAPQTVFVVVLRNPYEWLLSMQHMPHQAPKFQSLKLLDFISREWHGGWRNSKGGKINEMTWELKDAKKKIPFRNVIEMRTAKYLQWLDMQNMPGIRVAYVQYEKLLSDGGRTMIASILEASDGVLKSKEVFVEVEGHCDAFAWRSLKCAKTGKHAKGYDSKKSAGKRVNK